MVRKKIVRCFTKAGFWHLMRSDISLRDAMPNRHATQKGNFVANHAVANQLHIYFLRADYRVLHYIIQKMGLHQHPNLH